MIKLKVLALSIYVALSSGCASFIANNTDQAVGVTSGERSLGQVVIDKSIERTAKINMFKLDSRFNESRVNIKSFHSSVLLTGQVPDAHLKKLAEDNVRAMSDVKSVHNFLTVGEQASYSTIMQDLGVTANLKGLIIRAPVLRDSKVLFHTENGVLYVLGRLNNAESNDLAEVLQNVGNVTKIVTLIDNTEQISTAPIPASNTVSIGLSQATTMPTEQPDTSDIVTPVAIDPNDEQPMADLAPASNGQ